MNKNRLILLAGFLTGAIPTAIAMRSYLKFKHEMEAKREFESKTIWMAAGTVRERIRNGVYNTSTDRENAAKRAVEDFEFERIRFAEEMS